MSKTKGANGPLTLRCPKCGARNLGINRPIQPFGTSRKISRGGRTKIITPVKCANTNAAEIRYPICGHIWYTTHSSVRR